jgi:hypothetical protein
MRRVAALILAAGPALAEENPSLAWIAAGSGTPLTQIELGTFEIRGTELIGVDSLTFSPGYGWPWFPAPTGPARVAAFRDRSFAAISKAAVVFSDAVPVCGAEVGAMPVDTGTGAFLDRHTAGMLDTVARAMGRSCNLYDCLMADQMGPADFAVMIRLPDGSSFPAFSTGGGDGTYPVYLLFDAGGEPTAAYADFLGVPPDYAWLTPPVCPQPSS